MKAKLITNPTSLGDKLYNRRVELCLLQKDLASLIGVSEDTITLWENNRSKPLIVYFPKIIQFLGYVPVAFDETTLGGRIKKFRYSNGYTQERLAKIIGVDESTVNKYERNIKLPQKKFLIKLKLILQEYALH